jgi:hypothetical protein
MFQSQIVKWNLAAVSSPRTLPENFTLANQPARTGWLWPNVLNLDAPMVAVLWQVLLARSAGVRLNPFEPLVLALTVWLVYLADNLMDTLRPPVGHWEPPRKIFYRTHWRTGLWLAVLVALALIGCGSRLLWASTLRGGVQLSFAVLGYFSLIHLMPVNWRREWPREIVVAILFALGTFGAVWLAAGRHAAPLLAPAVIFMLLCWANCSVIETWEWQASGAPDPPNQVAQWGAKHLGRLGILIALLSAGMGSASLAPREFVAAACLSGVALSLLSLFRRAIPLRFVSPLTDLALCSPAAVLIFLWLH